MATKRVKIGIVGLGVGRCHLECFASDRNAEVAAVADPDEPLARSLAETFGVPKVYRNHAELIADPGIDAVVIAIPNYLHHTASIDAMNTGKHVLCEKPMALSASAAEEIVETAKRTGCKFMVGFNGRFKEETQFLKNVVDAGQIGDVYYAKARALRRRGTPQVDFPQNGILGRGHWFVEKDKAGAGALFDLGVHVLDSVLWLLGYPKTTTVSGAAYDLLSQQRFPEGEFSVEDLGVGFLRLENGTALSLEASWAVNHEDQWQLRLLGTKGGAKTNPLTLFTEEHGKLMEMAPLPGSIASNSGYSEQANYFVRCIAEDRSIQISTAEEGLEITRVVCGLLQSAAEGKELAREEWARNETADAQL